MIVTVRVGEHNALQGFCPFDFNTSKQAWHHENFNPFLYIYICVISNPPQNACCHY